MEDAPLKKKKKKRKVPSKTSGSATGPAVAVPALPPPAPAPSFVPLVILCLAGALLGGLFYHAAIKGSVGAGPAASGSASAGAPAGANADPLATPSDVASPPADAKKTASGLSYRVLKPGDNAKRPVPTDRVRVHYSGWSQDGKLFDSSYKRGEPATFGVTQVIKGWTEGLQLMSVGEKTRFWIPAALAYGDQAAGGRPSGQLTFDVELVEILAN